MAIELKELPYKVYQQNKIQLKFLNNSILIISLINDIIQKITDESKPPLNLRFWFNEQKSNVGFILGKIQELEFDDDITEKVKNIVSFINRVVKCLNVSSHSISFKIFLGKSRYTSQNRI